MPMRSVSGSRSQHQISPGFPGQVNSHCEGFWFLRVRVLHGGKPSVRVPLLWWNHDVCKAGSFQTFRDREQACAMEGRVNNFEGTAFGNSEISGMRGQVSILEK
jgi:hypothetical protein